MIYRVSIQYYSLSLLSRLKKLSGGSRAVNGHNWLFTRCYIRIILFDKSIRNIVSMVDLAILRVNMVFFVGGHMFYIIHDHSFGLLRNKLSGHLSYWKAGRLPRTILRVTNESRVNSGIRGIYFCLLAIVFDVNNLRVCLLNSFAELSLALNGMNVSTLVLY